MSLGTIIILALLVAMIAAHLRGHGGRAAHGCHGGGHAGHRPRGGREPEDATDL